MKILLPLAMVLGSFVANGATTLPVGTLTFASNSEYDLNFKEGTRTSIIVDTGKLRVSGNAVVGAAVFDTSATGGSGGNGGTGGSDNNNDLSNFTISSAIQVSNRDPLASAGYFMRLDAGESNGYLAIASFTDFTAPTHVRIELFEGVGLETLTLPSAIFTHDFTVTTSVNTDFTFAVTAVGGDFTFNFGAQSIAFTDTTVSATTGQAGVFLRTAPNVAGNTRMDNFTITAPVPEPSSWGVVMLSAGFLAILRKRR